MGTLGWRVWVTAGFLFLPLPIAIVVISSFSRSGYLQFPPTELSFRWYAEFLESPQWLWALLASVLLALFAAIVSSAIAFLAALARTRTVVPGAALFDMLMLSPLFIPHAAAALGLWSIIVWLGWLGSWPGLILAHCILCFPFAYRPIFSAARTLDLGMEEAALSLGASPMKVFRTISLPLLRPGLAAAFLFSFIISFDEISVTMFLVGPNVTTLPVRIFSEIQDNGSPVVAAISSVLVATTAIFFLLVDRFVGINVFVTGTPERPVPADEEEQAA